MLQRIRDSLGRWIFGVVIALISVSFIFWGVDFNLTGAATFAAKVNGETISLDEFDRELQMQQNQFQELYRIELDEDMRRQIRRSVIERLVQREALAQRVDAAGYRVSDERVIDSIESSSVFQTGGEFSNELYVGQLSLQGMSPRAFEEMQRQQLELVDLQVGIADSTFLTPAEYRRYVELTKQQRHIGYASFAADSFVDDVMITDAEIAAHYEENRDRYMTEEAAAIEYVELRRADIADSLDVTDAELEDYYERQRENFRTEEERRARHILITPAEDESDDETRMRAEQIAERVRSGEDFEALAEELSDDPGTAAQGGDLGWIARGMLEGPFENALFAMEAGQVEGPVKTDFGYHIIRLDEIRAGEEQAFADVRDQLLEDYRAERADEIFYERANALADRAFDAYDALAPVAMDLGLPLQTIERFPRIGDPEAFPNSAPIVDAVFGPEAEEIGINSDMIELAEDHAVVVRVTERFPPEQQPLEAVSAEIRETLTRQRAEELAEEAANAFLVALPAALTPEFLGADEAEGEGTETPSEAGAPADEAAGTEPAAADAASPAAQLAAMHGGTWVAPTWVERSDPNVPTEILADAFGLPAPDDGAPVREPVELASGDHAVLVMTGAKPGDPATVTAEERQRLQQQLVDQIGTGEIGGYAETVRQQADVDIPQDVLEPEF